MPLISNSPASYRSTADEILAHWNQANTVLNPNEIICKGSYTRDALQDDRDTLDSKINDVRAAIGRRQLIASRRSVSKSSLIDKLQRFRAGVANALMGTIYAANLPRVPFFAANEKDFLEPLFKMRERWREINAITNQVPDFTAPFILGDGTTLAQFDHLLAELQAIYRELDTVDAEIDRARRERDALLEPLKDRMQQYRQGVLARVGKNHPLSESLPPLRVTSSRPILPVRVTGQWDAASDTAYLTWNASKDAELDGYSVRTSSGATYRADEEDTVAFLPASATSWNGTDGLGVSGAEANFKVYVIIKGNRERGSNAVKVARPSV
jgi:hypothetical protein